MLKQFKGFLRDERGSYTLWSLAWFLLYVGIGGLAVDMTDAYRTQTLLQSTADASALAGVMSLPDEDEAVFMATGYASANMSEEVHGTVLQDPWVTIGTWDFSARTFAPGGASPNAVRAVTRRADDNGNPVLMSFLRIMQLWGIDAWWNINTDAIAVRGYHECDDDGFIAGVQLKMTSRNEFYNDFCLHGEDSFFFTGQGGNSTNYFEPGVEISTGVCPGDCLLPANVGEDDEYFQQAYSGKYPLPPINAYAVDGTLDALWSLPETQSEFETFTSDPDNEKYKAWDWLYASGSVNIETDWSTFTSDPDETTIYKIDCNGQLNLPSLTEPVDNVVIIATCPIHGSADVNFQSSILGSYSKVHIAAHGNFGNADCDDPKGVQIYSGDDVHLSAQGTYYGTSIYAKDKVKLTALGSSETPTSWGGIHVEAGGDIELSANNEFGLCPNFQDDSPKEWRYALVD